MIPKSNIANTIVQVEAVDLDKRGTQNSHVRYEIIKVSLRLRLNFDSLSEQKI